MCRTGDVNTHSVPANCDQQPHPVIYCETIETRIHTPEPALASLPFRFKDAPSPVRLFAESRAMPRYLSSLVLLCLATGLPLTASAEVQLPKIFGNHMVLQRDQENRIWGWAEAGEKLTISIAQHTVQTVTNAQGRFEAKLPAMQAGGPHSLTITGTDTVEFKDVLVGEVWVCSGQSNMQWSVDQANDPDLEKLTAKFPKIRLITVPRVGTQEPQDDFEGEWQQCSPETVGQFSAVGYFFGRQLHQTLNVPIGLIDNAWGGSACEAWIRRDTLEDQAQYQPLMDRWVAIEKEYATISKQPNGDKKAKQRLANVTRQMRGQHRPGNLYNGVLRPIIGYGIRGVIWYQGETNASRAYQYRSLFPLMIQQWRDEWKQNAFPFYWVSLADFRAEVNGPQGSDWAELREAQTMTMSQLENTGEAIIIDLGEAADIHPKNKQDVAKRLARWALARDYGFEIVHRSPIYQSMEIKNNKIVVTLDHVGGGLDTFDVREPLGFTIAGEDQKFVSAKAKIISANQIEIWSDGVTMPVAVRYAWADNPVCNVQNREGLPVTPFRSDDWPGVTADAK